MNTKDKKTKLYKLFLISLGVYMTISGIIKYINTRDIINLIFPIVLLISISWELYYQFLISGDKK